MNTLVLEGLEAHNPLGFLAALGLLRVLDHEATARALTAPRLRFVEQGVWIAQLTTDHTLDEVIDVVLRDAAAQSDNCALQLTYDADGNLVAPGTSGCTRDLKPSQEGARDLLQRASMADPRSAAQAAAWFSELVPQETTPRTKPTAFHFTAGNQAFLKIVERLRSSITAAHVREALQGPWQNTSPLPTLRWDASVARIHALRATAPADDEHGSVPGANWLAVLGLTFFPVVARDDRLVTTGVTGGWKDATFAWPVWSPPAELGAIASLVALDAAAWTAEEREALGIATVFRSRILRFDQGGYGSFSPAIVVPPRARTAH